MDGSLRAMLSFQELRLSPKASPTLVAGFTINRFSAYTNGAEGEWVPYFSLVINDKLNKFGVNISILTNRRELEIFLIGLSDIVIKAIKSGATQNDLQILINSFGNEHDPDLLKQVMRKRIAESRSLQKTQCDLEQFFNEYK